MEVAHYLFCCRVPLHLRLYSNNGSLLSSLLPFFSLNSRSMISSRGVQGRAQIRKTNRKIAWYSSHLFLHMGRKKISKGNTVTDGLQCRGGIQRETWGMGPYPGVVYSLTLSHSPLQSPAFHPNNDECQRIFHQLVKNGPANSKRHVRGKGREGGGGLTICLREDILWSIGNSMPELTLTPLHSWL
jgi:hypothetical protein